MAEKFAKVESENDAFHSKLSVRNAVKNKSISLRKPANIGCYSLEAKNTQTKSYSEDLTQLRYLYLPTEDCFCFDLNDGYNECIHWGEPDSEGLSHMFKWILNNRSKFKLANEKQAGQSLNTDFVCFRGLIAQIMSTPYERNEDWCIHATKFNGTIYLINKVTERKKAVEANRDDSCNRACFAGFRFEHYICTKKPGTMPKKNLIDTNISQNQLCAVFRTRLNTHSCVYAAEMDCIESDNPKILNFIEIKTTKEFESKRQYDNFRRYKILKWWAQSYLVGIKTIVCGYRDERNYVRKIERFSVDRLRELGEEYWSPNICLNFLDTFFTFVKQCAYVDDPKRVFEFYCDPLNKEITCRELKEEEYRFVPDCDIRFVQLKAKV
ncbi:protein Dom3Z-like protein [Dinothrombium tinctorium]|uniref:Decapping nuclease n=1 Tax=Dinothrombium tinctorium TaxID=1965070 RepID=A0A3S3P6Y9_9ACAR|nr:protein Dom3Z-like protein [Dinothrombium tinctorium]